MTSRPGLFTYFDSTRKTFSVRDNRSRKVCLKSEILVLDDCVFVVSERGRQRVLREKRKTVHAGIGSSQARTTMKIATKGMTPLRYNPYTGPDFVTMDGKPVKEARRVVCVVEEGRARVYASEAV